MLFYLSLAKIAWQDIHISCHLVSSPGADISATQVNLEEFAQQYFCHTLDIQTQCNSSIKSDCKIHFSPEKDKIGRGKFFFEVKLFDLGFFSTTGKSDILVWYLIVGHAIRFPFHSPTKRIQCFLSFSQTWKLTITLHQSKCYHFFLAETVKYATWLNSS